MHHIGKIIMIDSIWAILFLIIVIYLGYKDVRLGIASLLIIIVFCFAHLEHTLENNKNKESKNKK